MNARKAFALRINARVLEALQRWADDELRSLNGQIEYVLRDALRRAGRLKTDATPSNEPPRREPEP
ncbi:MAG: Arc family DNA-binding protein [Lysobacteraceae bacterium]